MRIISDFHDYYDVGMGLGHDQSVVYERFAREVEYDHCPFPHYYGAYWPRQRTIFTDSWVVGFCGKLYPVVEVNTLEGGGCQTKEDRSKRKFCFSLADVDSWVETTFSSKLVEMYYKRGYDRTNHWCSEQRHHTFAKYFEDIEKSKDSPVYVKHFEQQKSPIFLSHYKRLTRDEKHIVVFNSPLKQVEFFRRFDPYTAFQELSMYMSNMAVPIKPIPEISDEVMAEIKGFDRFSFRKDPSKKKK